MDEIDRGRCRRVGFHDDRQPIVVEAVEHPRLNLARIPGIAVGRGQRKSDGVLLSMAFRLPDLPVEALRSAVQMMLAPVDWQLVAFPADDEFAVADAVGIAAAGGAHARPAGDVFLEAVEAEHHVERAVAVGHLELGEPCPVADEPHPVSGVVGDLEEIDDAPAMRP